MTRLNYHGLPRLLLKLVPVAMHVVSTEIASAVDPPQFFAFVYQKMEMFIFHRDEYNRLYNCSLYSVEDVPIEKRQSVLLGYMFMVLFTIYEVSKRSERYCVAANTGKEEPRKTIPSAPLWTELVRCEREAILTIVKV